MRFYFNRHFPYRYTGDHCRLIRSSSRPGCFCAPSSKVLELREISFRLGADGFVVVFLVAPRDLLLERRVVQVIQQIAGNSISTYRTEYTTRDITIQEKSSGVCGIGISPF
jgi:hypothetical protein